MSVQSVRRTYWDCSIDEDCHREYTVRYLVTTTDYSDGPKTVGTAAGIPRIGATYQQGNDTDVYARCTPYLRITAEQQLGGEAHKHWTVELKYTTRPIRFPQRWVGNPLAEPWEVSGSFTGQSQEMAKSAWASASPSVFKSSSNEMLHGPQVTFDRTIASVRLARNVHALGVYTYANAMNKLNSDVWWYMPARTIRLASVTWERRFYNDYQVHDPYYHITLEFLIDPLGWDKTTIDEGTRAVGYWDKTNKVWKKPSGWTASNQNHLSRYRDRYGEIIAHVLLDGSGSPLGPEADPHETTISYYNETDFKLLGIPTDILGQKEATYQGI